MFGDFFKRKRVLVTGHTGFKGSWLSEWLLALGAEVAGVSLPAPTAPAHSQALELAGRISEHLIDVRDTVALNKVLLDFRPELIFHLAAQPIVAESYTNPADTWSTNVLGSISVMDATRALGKATLIMITSDKCYENVEWYWGYKESDLLGGADPYSSSKAAAEIAISSYARSFFLGPSSEIKIASVRAGNVIGGGDWAANRIVPDSIRAWASGETVILRNPSSTRPWQHVLEPLSGYLALAKALDAGIISNGEAFNFGPSSSCNHSVEDLVKSMARVWSGATWRVDARSDSFHEAGLLKLNCEKAASLLGWTPTLLFEETAEFTISWYKEFYADGGARVDRLTQGQIMDYCKLALGRGASWAET